MATKTTMITSPSLKVHTSSNSLGARRFQIPFRSASLSSNKIFSSVIRFRKSSELNRASVKSLSNPPTILSEDVGEVIGEISILRPTGEAVKFKQLWDQEEGVAVVALLRHFGCVCCWELAAALRDSKGRFDSAAVKLIAVGIGSPRNAQIFSGRLPFPWECLYADPDRKAYNALGLYYGIGRTFFNPASAKIFSRFNELREANKNYTIEVTPDDKSSVLQQGGMFVFKGKQLVYARKDEGTGDHAPLDDVFKVCHEVS
ncbi:unnamed protein product [Cuscuta europaea]|uniref:Thioredoxin-like protein AAED1, chloroplastic n=1 Tax=Cuscuta europaea TaxID=41803 RepID=A0A9P0YN00_CUSEU|nr:unnamed protein product [Cuscuta europaea]